MAILEPLRYSARNEEDFGTGLSKDSFQNFRRVPPFSFMGVPSWDVQPADRKQTPFLKRNRFMKDQMSETLTRRILFLRSVGILANRKI